MKKEMLINVLQPEECRIAILEDGILEELYVERTGHESYVGNIYKGRIVNIEPSIQAAFVDFGVGRNGFLHVSDVEPAYYRHLEQRRDDHGGRRNNGFRDRDSDRGRRPPRHGDDEPRRRDQDKPRLDTNSNAPVPARPEDLFAISAAESVAEIAVVAPPETLPTAETSTGSGDFVARDKPDLFESQDATTGQTQQEDEKAGRRRRGRGRGRGRGRREDSPPPNPGPGAVPLGDQPPGALPMPSAECRTRENDPNAPPPRGKVDLSDEELSFSPSRPPLQPDAPTLAQEPQSYFADDLDADEPFLDSQENQPAPVGEEDFEPEDLLPDSSGAEEEELDNEFSEERGRDFEAEDERPMPRRGRRDDRGDRGGGRGRDRGRGPRRNFPRPGFGRPKPLIQDIFKRGQEVLVQVIKEGIGTKGPTLSTYISIAGRYLVLMPGLNRIGVSRKIADDDQRRRLRDILNELEPPKGLGFIIRTAGLDRTKKELQRDLAYLSRLWQVVVRRIKKIKAPAEIYQESDMIIRTIRDTFTSEVDTIWVDEPIAFSHAQEFLQIVMPRYANRIKSYGEPEPMFHKYGIEEEIARIQRRHVPLPMGGSIVIDQTEALVAIDVNSGNFRADNNAEETAYQMNLHAAKEIARQLRLRDLGGVIVNDFIDMRDEKHCRNVEKALRDAIKRDRARTKILRISQFGIIEMTRQRIRPSLKRSVYQDCAHCVGTGQVKTTESMSIDVMRMLQLAVHRPAIQRIEVKVHRDVANYLQNRKRKVISQFEETGNTSVYILGDPLAPPEQLGFVCYDNNNNEVKFLPTEEPPRPRRR